MRGGGGVENVPQETGHQPRRVSSLWLWMLIFLAGYLLFRLVQGVLWLVDRL